jgi:putative ABC transport system permease protein
VDWKTHLRAALSGDGNPPDEDVVEELSQHACAAYDAARAGGCSHTDASRRVEALITEWRRGAPLLRRRPAAGVSAPPPQSSHWFAGTMQDVRYGCRALLRQPGFTAVAVVTLALGIGCATAIFSVIHNVLLDPAPYADLDRVVYIQIRGADSPALGGRTWYSVPEFLEYQRQSQVFEDIIAGSTEDVLIRTGEGVEQFRGALVTPNTFPFTGLPPTLGRLLTSGDAEPNAPPVFVMSYQVWVSRYGSDPSVVGRSFVLNGVPTTCVGVVSRRFTKQAADLWKPVALGRGYSDVDGRIFRFQAKLKPGVTLDQATAEINVIARRVASMYPSQYPERFTVQVVQWVDNLVRQFRSTLYTLFAAVVVLLLVACGNIANMLLARGMAREKELAVRRAMGASRLLLTRQLLVESVLLGCAGAVLGCAFAFASIKGLAAIIPVGTIPNEVVLRMNTSVLFFNLAIGVVTAVIFGLVPALYATRGSVSNPLNETGRTVAGGFRSVRLKGALVVTQVALSLLLLAGAGLLMRSFITLQTIDLGFDPDNVLFARLPLPPPTYTTADAKRQFFDEVLRQIGALPGVVVAAHTSSLHPFSGLSSEVDVPGRAHVDRWDALYQLCSDTYFQTMRFRLLQGRTLSATEIVHARKVAVVNQTLVNRYFGAESPIGRTIRLKNLESLPGEDAVRDATFEIVGVVADAKNRGLVEPPQPEAFIPYTITGAFPRGILVRTHSNPETFVSSIRRQVWTVDPGVAMTDVGTARWYLGQFSYAEPRFSLVLLGAFAFVGLVLVTTGVYGLIAYTVSRQTREIGIRMALGAQRREVLWMVGTMGLRLITVGSTLGLVGSLVAAHVLSSQLPYVSPHDPLTFIAVIAVMMLVGIAACYVPARRAANVDPLVALRSDFI